MRYFLILLISAAISACGPMNTLHEHDARLPQSSAGAAGDVGLSKSSRFYVYASLVQREAKPELGDNLYAFRIARTSDLSAPALQVSVTYGMPTMPEMGTETVTAERQADGSYTATLFYSMPGGWEATLRIDDAGTMDDYVFQLEL